MTLYEGKAGKSYLAGELFLEESITRRLQALGLNEGTNISILNRKNKGAMIIKVRGTRLALGRHLSSNIEIKEEGGR